MTLGRNKQATELDGECNVCDSWWHLMLTVGQIRLLGEQERGKWVRRSAGNTMGQVGPTPDVTST